MDSITAIFFYLGKKNRTRRKIEDTMLSLIFRSLLCFGTVQNWQSSLWMWTSPLSFSWGLNLMNPTLQHYPPCSVCAHISHTTSWGKIQWLSEAYTEVLVYPLYEEVMHFYWSFLNIVWGLKSHFTSDAKQQEHLELTCFWLNLWP